jgi:hypothetical protein
MVKESHFSEEVIEAINNIGFDLITVVFSDKSPTFSPTDIDELSEIDSGGIDYAFVIDSKQKIYKLEADEAKKVIFHLTIPVIEARNGF